MKTDYRKRVLAILVLGLAVILSNFCVLSQAQTQTTFTSADEFSIPSQNSTIRFAAGGSYASATLQNGTWTFIDLTLNYSSATFLGINNSPSPRTLRLSAESSNITILAFQNFNYSSPISILSYTVVGEGSQTVNLGLDPTQPTDSSEWSVIVPDNVFLAQGEGWQLLPDDSLLVTAAASNVTIIHFDFGESMGNVGFLLQHYVLLLAGVVLAVTVAVAVLVRMRTQRHARNSNKQSEAR